MPELLSYVNGTNSVTFPPCVSSPPNRSHGDVEPSVEAPRWAP